MSSHSHHSHYPCAGSTSSTLPAFSALHLLRSCNNLLVPTDFNQNYHQLINPRLVSDLTNTSRTEEHNTNNLLPSLGVSPAAFVSPHNLFSYPSALSQVYFNEQKSNPLLTRSLSVSSCLSSTSPKRQRGEKKPIPDDQKDEKYFERRKRNNQAAKKSRDARKIREDQIALRATMLEHENAILRAQVLTLREETASLKQMLFVKKSSDQLVQDLQICRQS